MFGAGGAVQDRPDLGEQLAEADLADAGQRGQQPGLGVLGEPLADRPVEFGDGGKQRRGEQLDCAPTT